MERNGNSEKAYALTLPILLIEDDVTPSLRLWAQRLWLWIPLLLGDPALDHLVVAPIPGGPGHNEPRDMRLKGICLQFHCGLLLLNILCDIVEYEEQSLI